MGRGDPDGTQPTPATFEQREPMGASPQLHAFGRECVAEAYDLVPLNCDHDVRWVTAFFKEALRVLMPTAGELTPHELNDRLLLAFASRANFNLRVSLL